MWCEDVCGCEGVGMLLCGVRMSVVVRVWDVECGVTMCACGCEGVGC